MCIFSTQVSICIISAAVLAHEEHHAPAHYKFDYGVHDPHTHDVKSQWEHRDGDHVKGAYTLKEADGTTRLVEYTADPHSGFNAVVKRIGHAHHPAHYGHHGGAHHGGHGGNSFVGVTHWGFKH
ncbi:cuticle protein 19-like isoform X1 [Coccinella septempunctata]|uniref:cuticle protein 19-like isoform X1 n=1 Tax=Coccinella septempunctata TaxID=41139 RepID=UPI001D0961BB|nr:cuticle protein 19-like isoform X1 [Coccinella septempunctata]